MVRLDAGAGLAGRARPALPDHRLLPPGLAAGPRRIAAVPGGRARPRAEAGGPVPPPFHLRRRPSSTGCSCSPAGCRAYDIQVARPGAVQARIEAGQGCILLGAHLGSFEVLRAVADQGCPVPVKVADVRGERGPGERGPERAQPRRTAGVIRIGSTGAMLQVKEALAAGELVGILGDRITSGDKVVTAELPRPARHPAGGADRAGCRAQGAGDPVLRHPSRGRRYEVCFVPFAERVAITPRTTGRRISRLGAALCRSSSSRHAGRIPTTGSISTISGKARMSIRWRRWPRAAASSCPLAGPPPRLAADLEG